MRKTWYESKQWTFADVKKQMVNYYIKHYGGSEKDNSRELVIIETKDKYEGEIIYFMLHGSPPKGHATWIEEYRSLTIFSPRYEVWRNYHLSKGLKE